MSDSILSPSLSDLHSDAFVTIDSLPADERAFAADAFGWDHDDERRNDDALLARYPGLAKLSSDALPKSRAIR
jgi:hypothetical protein